MPARLKKIKAVIERLRPKKSVVYHTGVTCSVYDGLTEDQALELGSYFKSLVDSGQWDFTQRCIMRSLGGVGVYEYIATKRLTKYVSEV